MTQHPLFLIGISFLIVHEMDAIRCKEWRIYPGLSLFSDQVGQLIFVFAHIPLIFIVLYQLMYGASNEVFINWFNVFMIVQLGLHLLLLKHMNNEFRDWISWTLIIGAGLFGLADLLID